MEVALYSEAVAHPHVADLLPINALRNAATLPARTPLIMLLDVDMLISANLLPALAARCAFHCNGPSSSSCRRRRGLKAQMRGSVQGGRGAAPGGTAGHDGAAGIRGGDYGGGTRGCCR